MAKNLCGKTRKVEDPYEICIQGKPLLLRSRD